LKVLVADLHIHTCLSPCATLDMTPRKIVRAARDKGLDIIAVTDHNSAENAGAVMAAAGDAGPSVIPGIEVTTSEEVHILGLFGGVREALAMQDLVYENLQPGENDEDLFGMQVIANEFDEVEGFNKRLLIGATALPIGEVVTAIHRFHGLAVAAHMDREAFSIVGQLGFIPEDLPLDALEVSKGVPLALARARFSRYEDFAFITSSDAHQIGEVGTSPTSFLVAGPDLAELSLAFRGRGNRDVRT